MTYQEQLQHPEWQKKRLQILQLFNFECTSCGEDGKQLHVHHKYYEKGKKIWEYPDNAYDCLCGDCHTEEHTLNDRLNKVIAMLGMAEKEILLGYAYVLGEPIFDPEPISPEIVDGMADYFRISSTELLQFVMNNKNLDLFKLADFARTFYNTLKDYRTRGV